MSHRCRASNSLPCVHTCVSKQCVCVWVCVYECRRKRDGISSAAADILKFSSASKHMVRIVFLMAFYHWLNPEFGKTLAEVLKYVLYQFYRLSIYSQDVLTSAFAYSCFLWGVALEGKFLFWCWIVLFISFLTAKKKEVINPSWWHLLPLLRPFERCIRHLATTQRRECYRELKSCSVLGCSLCSYGIRCSV